MKTTGKYYKSLKEYQRKTGNRGLGIRNCPCIHVSGSVKGMRKQFWGYQCDVVRIGNWIYKINYNN